MSSLVKINFIGKEKAAGRVFETTIAEEARKAGIFDEKKNYGPETILLGGKEIINGLDEALQKMKKGEEQTIHLMPENAFGARNPELIAMVPLKEFKQRNVKPMPGLVVDINDRLGKVQSVSGGRVRVDFNHDLAGKEVEYWVKLEEIIEGKEKIADALIERMLPFIDKNKRKIEFKENELMIELPVLGSGKIMARIALLKPALARQLAEAIGIESVKFIEFFKKQEKKK